MFCFGVILEIRSYCTSYLSGILEGRRLSFQTFVPPGVEGASARIMEGARSKQFLNERMNEWMNELGLAGL